MGMVGGSRRGRESRERRRRYYEWYDKLTPAEQTAHNIQSEKKRMAEFAAFLKVILPVIGICLSTLLGLSVCR